MSAGEREKRDAAKVYIKPDSPARELFQAVLAASGYLPPFAGPEADGREHWRLRAQVAADPAADFVTGEDGREYWIGFGG